MTRFTISLNVKHHKHCKPTRNTFRNVSGERVRAQVTQPQHRSNVTLLCIAVQSIEICLFSGRYGRVELQGHNKNLAQSRGIISNVKNTHLLVRPIGAVIHAWKAVRVFRDLGEQTCETQDTGIVCVALSRGQTLGVTTRRLAIEREFPWVCDKAQSLVDLA